MLVYLVGSLRNSNIPIIANRVRELGLECFDDWYSAGPEADDKLQAYEQGRGHSYVQALRGLAVDHIFSFDKTWLSRCDAGVLVMPAGKSAHLELGWLLGQGKPGYILLDGEPERYDIMYRFATDVFLSVEEMLEGLKQRLCPSSGLDGYRCICGECRACELRKVREYAAGHGHVVNPFLMEQARVLALQTRGGDSGDKGSVDGGPTVVEVPRS